MTIRNLDHVNMTVRDFDETVDWYRRVFGFELVEDKVTDRVRWGVIRSGDAMLCIYEHPHRQYLDQLDHIVRAVRKGGLFIDVKSVVRIEDLRKDLLYWGL